jgi:ATP-dependent DNA ligase
VPLGDGWHELRHDGLRIVVRNDGERVSLSSRNAGTGSVELAAITAAVVALPFATIV